MIGDSVVDDHRTAQPGRTDSEGRRYLRAHPSVDVDGREREGLSTRVKTWQRLPWGLRSHESCVHEVGKGSCDSVTAASVSSDEEDVTHAALTETYLRGDRLDHCGLA